MASTSDPVCKDLAEDANFRPFTQYLIGSALLVPMVNPGGYDIFTCDRVGIPADHWMRKEMLTRILEHPNASVIVKNLTGVYVLVGRFDEQCLVRPREKKWSDMLTQQAYQKLQHDTFIILGWILVTKCPGENKVYGIDLLESYVRGENVGEMLIYRAERYLDATGVLPIDISGQGYGYWKKILPRRFSTREDFVSYCERRDIKDPDALFRGYEGIWDSSEDEEEEEEEDGQEEENVDNKTKKKKQKLDE